MNLLITSIEISSESHLDCVSASTSERIAKYNCSGLNDCLAKSIH